MDKDDIELEQAFGRYSFNRDFNISFGRQLTALGYESDELILHWLLNLIILILPLLIIGIYFFLQTTNLLIFSELLLDILTKT